MLLPSDHDGKFAGYCLSGDHLYVQDGAQLKKYDLNESNPQQEASLSLAPNSQADSQTFSPPVVRQQQIGSGAMAQVFSLSSGGTIYALGDDLTRPQTYSSDPPAVCALAAAETEQHCYLYYVTRSGAVRRIDATASLEPEGMWQPQGTTRVLHPAYVDSLVWTGGVQNAALCALPYDRPGVRGFCLSQSVGLLCDYRVFPPGRLVLASDSVTTRLECYDPNAKVQARWGEYKPGKLVWTTFWQPTNSQTSEASSPDQADPNFPGLILEFDRTADQCGHLWVRVFVANTVDPPEPDLVPAYPPPPTVLVSARLDWGSFPDGPGPITGIVADPLVDGNSLYLLATELPGDGTTRIWFGAFSLETLVENALDEASNELTRLRDLVEPIVIQVVVFSSPFHNATVWVTLMPPWRGPGVCTIPVEPLKYQTDEAGRFTVAPGYAGCELRAVNVSYGEDLMSCDVFQQSQAPPTLQGGAVNTLTLTVK
jgi:hypothetical protein